MTQLSCDFSRKQSFLSIYTSQFQTSWSPFSSSRCLLTRVCFWRAYCSLCLVGFSPSHPPASPPPIHVAPSRSSPSHLNWNTSSQRGLHGCPLNQLPREHLKLPFLFLITLVIAAASVPGTGKQWEYKNIVESYETVLCNGWGLDSCNSPSAPSRAPWIYGHLLKWGLWYQPCKVHASGTTGLLVSAGGYFWLALRKSLGSLLQETPDNRCDSPPPEYGTQLFLPCPLSVDLLSRRAVCQEGTGMGTVHISENLCWRCVHLIDGDENSTSPLWSSFPKRRTLV